MPAKEKKTAEQLAAEAAAQAEAEALAALNNPPSPPPSVLDDLLAAVINGKEDVVNQLLTRYNVNYSDPAKQLTLLMWAVEANEIAIAENLLKKGALQHLTDPTGYTALHRAAFKKNQEMTKLLLRFDSSIDNINRTAGASRRTPLILAAMQGSLSVVEAILSQIASSPSLVSVVDSRDSAGMSAIDHAAFRGFESIVKILTENGASCNATLFFAGDGARHAMTLDQRAKYEGLLKFLYSPWSEQSVVTP